MTSLAPTAKGDAVLVSTLDSTLRLMDRSDGRMLRSYAAPGEFRNGEYRTRSALGGDDGYALSGSEDGYVYAWDVLSGEKVARVRHCEDEGVRTSKKVVSAVACRKGGSWASAGGDGKFADLHVGFWCLTWIFLTDGFGVGSIVVWGEP